MICCCPQGRKTRKPRRKGALIPLLALLLLAASLFPQVMAANNTTPATNDANLTLPATTAVSTTPATTVQTTLPVPLLKRPKIEFTANPVDGTAPLVVTFFPVFNSTGGAPDYLLWDFGDGQQLNRTLATSYEHSYLVAGTYTVTLTSVNAAGDNLEVRQDYITVRIPVTTAAATTAVTTVPQTSAAVTATTAVPTVTQVAVVTNTTGNLTVSQTNVTPGNVSPCRFPNLTVADFTAVPSEGTAPLKVRFSDNSSCAEPVEWQWDFGILVNPGIRTLRSPEVTYTDPGNYTVTLTVKNRLNGSSTITRRNAIRVTPPATRTPLPTVTSRPTTVVQVVPDFVANVTAGEAPLSVRFTDTSSGTAVNSWSWDFGDGSNATAKEPVHVYRNPGTYTVVLHATAGNATPFTKVKENYIQVREPGLQGLGIILVIAIIAVIGIVALLLLMRRRPGTSARAMAPEEPKPPGRRRGGDL